MGDFREDFKEALLSKIRRDSASDKPLISSGRSEKIGRISYDDLVFVPAQLYRKPADYYLGEKIESKTVIGRKSRKPIILDTPILIAGMSFGALSREAKIVLAKASRIAGTAENTGEGGMLPEERRYAKILIAQYSTARFGVDMDYLKKADAIEIKIGQGAKPGQGGLLPKEKVTKEILRIRKLKKIEDIHSPVIHPDIKNINDLKRKVGWLKKATGGKPIIIKLGAGDVGNDVKLALKANPDAIAIDGLSGGTAAAPEIMLDEFGIPILAAITKARDVMNRLNAKQELLVGGGLSKSSDMAKALALGADAVFLGFSLLVAMGCTYCRQCYKGVCPMGITTQNPELRKKLNTGEAVKKVSNYIKSCTEEIKMAAAATGKRNVHDLNKDDLRSLDETVSRITGVKMV